MTRTIELVYDCDCPNVEAARSQLRRALIEVGLDTQWKEWDREGADVPDHVRHYGSPTILVNGKDVAGLGTEADSNSCRVYADADGRLQGIPSVEMIRAALVALPD